MQIFAFNYWIFLGVLFLILEIIIGRFYVIFIGLSALLVGILTWTQILNHSQLEIGIFIVLSIVGTAYFRGKLRTLINTKSKYLKSTESQNGTETTDSLEV